MGPFAIFASKVSKFYQGSSEHKARLTKVGHTSRFLEFVYPGCRHLWI